MIITDTGFFITLGNKKDKFHSRAKQQLYILKEPLITTYPVVVKTSYLFWERYGQETQFNFLRQLIQGKILLFSLENNPLKRMLELMIKYSNLSTDLADASLVLLAEKISENRILTTDFHDFSVYRCHDNKKFNIILG